MSSNLTDERPGGKTKSCNKRQKVNLGNGYSMAIYDAEMISRLTNKCLPARCRRSSESAPSSVNAGVLQVHVLASVGWWVVDVSFMTNPTDWTSVSIN